MTKVLIIETTGVVTTVTKPADLEPLTNGELLGIYNAAAHRATTKFANRVKAREQTFAALTNVVAVDLRPRLKFEGTLIFRDGDALPEELRTPAASGSAPPDQARAKALQPGTTEEVTDQVIPASRGAGRVGRPVKASPARKQKDGTYVFAMDPRVPRGKTMGGRRPELVKLLKKRPTFKQLLNWYKPHGETDEQRAFNLATAMTCMGHVAGYGFYTAPDGRIDLLEPLS